MIEKKRYFLLSNATCGAAILLTVILALAIQWRNLLEAAALNVVFSSITRNHQVSNPFDNPYFGLGLRKETLPPQRIVETGGIGELFNPNWSEEPTRESHAENEIRILETLLSAGPTSGRVHWLLGRLYLLEHSWPRARSHLEQAAEIANCSDPVGTTDYCGYLWIDLGDLYDALGYPDKALQFYARNQNFGRKEAVALILAKVTQSLLDSGNREAAIHTSRWIPPELSSLLGLKLLTVRVSDGPSSWDELRYFSLSALRPARDPRLEEMNADAVAWLIKSGIWDEAQLERVVAYRVWQYAKWPSIERYIQRLIGHFPSNGKLLYYCGEYYQRNAEWQKSLQCYEQALALEPSEDRALFRLSAIWEYIALQEGISPIEKRERLEKVIYFLERYLERQPKDILAVRKLKDVYALLGDGREGKTLQSELRSTQRLGHKQMTQDGILARLYLGFERWYPYRPLGWSGPVIQSDGIYNRKALLVVGPDPLDAFEGQLSARIDCLWERPGASVLLDPQVALWYWDEVKNARGTVFTGSSRRLELVFAIRAEGSGQAGIYAETIDGTRLPAPLTPVPRYWRYQSASLPLESQAQSVHFAVISQGCTRVWLDAVDWIEEP